MTDINNPMRIVDDSATQRCVNLPVKVHLMGGEGAGWALDQDFDIIQRALRQIPDQVELVSLRDAEVVHTVWDDALDRLGPKHLAGKFVVCHICTNVYKMMERAASLRRQRDVGLWVTQTGEANEAASQLKWPHHYVPYACDLNIFGEALASVTRDELGIPPDRFLVGNFMRDSLGANLDAPKPEKGADLFLEVISGLKSRGIPVHVLLAGPRRHWIRRRLVERGVSFTFVGQMVEDDDMEINILLMDKIASLYRVLDLYLITSRHEGGPRAVLEAAASRTPILSTRVGLAKDVLQPSCLYSAVDECIDKVCDIVRTGYGADLLDLHRNTVVERHSVESVARRFAEMYQDMPHPVVRSEPVQGVRVASGVRLSCRHWLRRGIAHLRGQQLPGLGIKICLWHEFHKPPYGGGNQFMLALQKALRALGVDVVNNQLDDSVDVYICNAIWFDPQLLEKLSAGHCCRIIHRLDGLVHVARGQTDSSIDDRAYEFNRRFATATVMQSEWCLKQAMTMGYKAVNPVIIHNASDPAIFFPPTHESSSSRTRIIATSWSDNPRKGAGLYKTMENKLDWSLFDFTFVGRTQESFDRIRVFPPKGSEDLAHLLRRHDVYITASRSEACSNALIEALSCGLPALYIKDGGNPEVVELGGLSFEGESDVLPQLLRLARYRNAFRQCIRVETLHSVAMRYLELAQEVMRR